MKETIREVMTAQPVVVHEGQSIAEAATCMRDNRIGAVLVTKRDQLCGIITDRDIVVRAIADAKDANETKVGDLCTRSLTFVSPDDGVDEVIDCMRQHAIRRVPVVEDGKPVGIVSLGDLAIARDLTSLLGAISAAPATS
jgi:CBS domain-containing protein